MLGNKKSGFSISGSTTLISPETVIIGDLHFSGNLDVEGLVQGNIIAQPDKDAVVRVVNKGRVEGEIRAPSVIINGVVQGDIHSSRHLELASKGRVQGDVYYTQVEMAAGSEVNGSLTHVHESGADNAGSSDPTVAAVESAGKADPGKTTSAKVD